MVKFSRFRARPNVRSELKTIGAPVSRTHEGARAYRRDPKSELFLLAVTNMVDEPEIGGFTDATFRLMKHLENLRDADWPF